MIAVLIMVRPPLLSKRKSHSGDEHAWRSGIDRAAGVSQDARGVLNARAGYRVRDVVGGRYICPIEDVPHLEIR